MPRSTPIPSTQSPGTQHERRDPYAAAWRFEAVGVDSGGNGGHLWLWVPAFAGTTWDLPSSLPSAQLRTGAGTHTPRPGDLRQWELIAVVTADTCGYGSPRSRGRRGICRRPCLVRNCARAQGPIRRGLAI